MKTLIYIPMIIMVLMVGRLYGQFVNNGSLFISSSSTLFIPYDYQNNAGGQTIGDGEIVIEGDFNNEGIFSSAYGTVEIGGTSAQNINGTSVFANLKINNTGSEVILNNDITVNNTLEFVSGDFNLNGYNIILGVTAYLLNENENSHVKGTSGVITTTRYINSPDNLNVANLGIVITSDSNFGTTVIERGHTEQSGNGETNILRYYDIHPSNNSNLNATVRYYYFDDELNGISENDLSLWRSIDSGISWTVVQPDIVNYIENYLQKNNITSFSRWIGGTKTTTLAISLLSFEVNCNDSGKIISWSTISENNSDHFTLEKSYDAKNYEIIKAIPAAGFSNSEINYSYTDNDNSGIVYYRLTEYDLNGGKTIIGEEPVSCTYEIPAQFSIYPNPAYNYVNLEIIYNNNEKYEYQIIDISGRIVGEGSIDVQPGLYIQQIDVSDLAKSIYTLRILQSDTNMQFIKQ